MIAVLLIRTKSRVDCDSSSHSVVVPLATITSPHSSVSRRNSRLIRGRAAWSVGSGHRRAGWPGGGVDQMVIAGVRAYP